MITLKIDLIQENNAPVNSNYNKYLRRICFNLLNGSKNYKNGNIEELFEMYEEDGSQLITYSKLNCLRYEINGNNIIFNDKVNWYISSPEYELILSFVQKFFREPIVKIGNAEFKVVGLEILKEEEMNKLEVSEKIG